MKIKKEGEMNKTKTERKCTNKFAGMIVWKDVELLMIERKKPPFGIAIPTGHLKDGEDFKDAATRELKEETGLIAVKLTQLLEGVLHKHGFICSAGSTDPHKLILYRVLCESYDIVFNNEETKSIGWHNIFKICELALRTERYLKDYISEKEWEKHPGIVPICYNWFKDLGILSAVDYKKTAALF